MKTLTIQNVLTDFYKENNFDQDGGERLPYAKAEITSWFKIYIPNPEVRQRILHLHDVHHLLTEFKTSMIGESEISAWEISSGCRSNWFAFYINSVGVMSMLPINLPRIWKAFNLGKRTKNLYKAGYSKEELMEKEVEELKVEMGLLGEKQKARQSTFLTLLSFLGFLPIGILLSILSIAIMPFILLYTLFWMIRLR